MKNRNLSSASIALSFVLAFAVLKINHAIAVQYSRSDGKTKAQFSIIESLNYGYQYWLIVISLLEIIFLVFALKKREEKPYLICAIFLLILSTILIFMRTWRWMI